MQNDSSDITEREDSLIHSVEIKVIVKMYNYCVLLSIDDICKIMTSSKCLPVAVCYHRFFLHGKYF